MTVEHCSFPILSLYSVSPIPCIRHFDIKNSTATWMTIFLLPFQVLQKNRPERNRSKSFFDLPWSPSNTWQSLPSPIQGLICPILFALQLLISMKAGFLFLLVPTGNFKLLSSRFKISALQGCWAFPRFSRLRFDEPRPTQQQQQVSRWTALFLKLTISRWQCPLRWCPAFEDFRCDIKRNFKSYNEESDRRDRHFSFHWTLDTHIASWSKRNNNLPNADG